MGCVLCNITGCREFTQGTEPPVLNPFYCKTSEERSEFIEELCADIALRHPEVVKRIMYFTGVALGKRLRKRFRSLCPF